jgi:hypothetical protein
MTRMSISRFGALGDERRDANAVALPVKLAESHASGRKQPMIY